MLKKLIRLNLDDILLFSGVVGGIFLLVQLVTAGVMFFLKPEEGICISGLLMLIAAAIFLMIGAASHVMITFNQALQFGQTRKRALGLSLGVLGAESLLTLALMGALSWTDCTLSPKLWQLLSGASGYVLEVNGEPVRTVGSGLKLLLVEYFSIDWWWFPLVVLAAVAVGFIGGAAIQRFGRKGFWALWAVWMVGCIGPQLLPWKQYEITNWLIPALVAVGLGGLVWAVWSLLHAVVKS